MDRNNSVLIEVRHTKFGTNREFVECCKFVKYHRYKYKTIENIKVRVGYSLVGDQNITFQSYTFKKWLAEILMVRHFHVLHFQSTPFYNHFIGTSKFRFLGEIF